MNTTNTSGSPVITNKQTTQTPVNMAMVKLSAAYSLAETAKLLAQSTNTVRKLIASGKLRRVDGFGAVRVSARSIEDLLSAALQSPVSLTRELAAHGSCLVYTPYELADLYHVHVNTIYIQLARGTFRSVPWLRNRRIPKTALANVMPTRLED